MTWTLRTRLVLTGVFVTAAPLLVLAALLATQSGKMVDVSRAECERLATNQLSQIADSISSVCSTRQEDLDLFLRLARTVLEREGGAALAGTRRSWSARNQSTGDRVEVELPRMSVGGTLLDPVDEFSRSVPVVDEVRRLTGATCTIFQRMSAGGDMLRVATSVATADGKRAVGTYIPATAGNGAANAVIASVLAGRPFVGRAFVVDQWYTTAYEPLRARDGQIIGMLYVGVHETVQRGKVRDFAARALAGQRSSVFILDAEARSNGEYAVRPVDGAGLSWDVDSAQRASMITAVTGAREARIPSYRYRATVNGADTAVVTSLRYFPAWNWVIGVSMPEDEYGRTASTIASMLRQNLWFLGFGLGAAVLIGAAVWVVASRHLTARLTGVAAAVAAQSGKLVSCASEIAGAAESQAATTNEQAAAVEQTSASTEEIHAVADRNQTGAAEALRAVSAAVVRATSACDSVSEMRTCMEEIDTAAAGIADVMRSIEEIAFQTNILALNAAIEAAHAGQAGAGFAVVAGEVRALAGKCADAVRRTADLIEHSTLKTALGRERLEQVNTAVHAMAEDARKIREHVEAVNQASGEQARGTEQIAAALSQIDVGVQKSAAVAGQTASVASALREQADALRSEASALSVLVLGRLTTVGQPEQLHAST